MLNVENLTLHYGASQILYGIDLVARPGAVTAVMGTNGVGKTSLLKAIAGRHPYSGGTITLDGQDLRHLNAAQAAKAGIAYVPQGRENFPAADRDRESANRLCLSAARPAHDPAAHLRIVPGAQTNERAARGAICRAGSNNSLPSPAPSSRSPRVLLLDEPTEGIQPNIIKQIGEVIKLLREEGEIAIVLVEQFFDFAYDLADEFVAINRGEVRLAAPAAQVTREKASGRGVDLTLDGGADLPAFGTHDRPSPAPARCPPHYGRVLDVRRDCVFQP